MHSYATKACCVMRFWSVSGRHKTTLMFTLWRKTGTKDTLGAKEEKLKVVTGDLTAILRDSFPLLIILQLVLTPALSLPYTWL